MSCSKFVVSNSVSKSKFYEFLKKYEDSGKQRAMAEGSEFVSNFEIATGF